jgi:hypothetical protein
MSSKKDDEPTYPVGHKKPPKHGQFKKGHSGNPSGKKNNVTGSLPLEIAKLLSKTATVVIAGKPQKMSNNQIIATQIVDAAKKKDFKAISVVRDLMRDATTLGLVSPVTGNIIEEKLPPVFSWTEEEEKLVQQMEEAVQNATADQPLRVAAFSTVRDFCALHGGGGTEVKQALDKLGELISRA